MTELEPGMPADKAGMKLGDDIVAVNGQPMRSIEAMIESLEHNKDKPIEITVVRDGQELTLHAAAGSGRT